MDEPVPPTTRRVSLRGRAGRRTIALVFLSLLALGGRAHAHDGGHAGASGGDEDKRSRATWAALLAGYIALGALTTGGAYLLRDNFGGRGVAVTAAGWGGLGMGAGLGYGIARLRNCGAPDCSAEADVASGVGGFLGSLAGTFAGYLMTSDPGMSRPYTAAAGMAPVFILLSIGTITNW